MYTGIQGPLKTVYRITMCSCCRQMGCSLQKERSRHSGVQKSETTLEKLKYCHVKLEIIIKGLKIQKANKRVTSETKRAFLPIVARLKFQGGQCVELKGFAETRSVVFKAQAKPKITPSEDQHIKQSSLRQKSNYITDTEFTKYTTQAVLWEEHCSSTSETLQSQRTRSSFSTTSQEGNIDWC